MSNPQNKQTIRTAELISAAQRGQDFSCGNADTIQYDSLEDLIVAEFTAQFQPSPVNKETKEGETNPYQAIIEKRIAKLEAAMTGWMDNERLVLIDELKNILKEAKG